MPKPTQQGLFDSILESLASEASEAPKALSLNKPTLTEKPDPHGFGEAVSWENFSEEDYIRLADGLLKTSIEKAFGISRGGGKFTPDQEAQDWIFADTMFAESDPLSFENCARTIGLDPVELRVLLERLKNRLNI